MHQDTAEKYSPLAWPAYTLAALLIVLPFVDILLAVLPAPMRGVAWRFGAVGLVSGALTLPMLGLVLALTLAIVLGHVAVKRVVGVVAAALTFALVCALVLFVLDTVQMRAQIQAAATARFLSAAVWAFAKLVLFTILGVLVSRTAFRVARDQRGRGHAHRTSAMPAATLVASAPDRRGTTHG